MSKFKVGDTVWVKPLNEIHNRDSVPLFVPKMEECCQKKYRVIKISHLGFPILDTNYIFSWKENWLETEEEHEKRENSIPKFQVGEVVYLKPKEEMHKLNSGWYVVDCLNRIKDEKLKVIRVDFNYATYCNVYTVVPLDDMNSNVYTLLEPSLETPQEHAGRLKAAPFSCVIHHTTPAYVRESATDAAELTKSTVTNEGLKVFDEGKGDYEEMAEILRKPCEATIKMELSAESKENLMQLVKGVHEEFEKKRQEVIRMNIPKSVIFNNPATIVFWKDGSKTISKAHNEAFDPEKGLAICYAKKALGDGYEASKKFDRIVKKYLPKAKETDDDEPKVNPAVELVEQLNDLERHGVVLSRAKKYKFDDGQVVQFSKKIDCWVISLDK